jgi:2-polyprenyl-3-methyl-5-hydroxy-6-metoxy-1,4-benzoquinol methylase
VRDEGLRQRPAPEPAPSAAAGSSRTARPKIAVLVVAYNAVTTLAKVLDRIPSELWDSLSEVYVFDDASGDETAMLSRAYKHERGRTNLNIYRNDVNQGYGGNQKLGYRYAIERGFDIVVLLHGDGQYAPEVMPEILRPLVEGRADAVLGTRMTKRFEALKGGMPLYKYVGNRILSTFQNLALETRLSEFHSGYRAYSVAALKSIPFELNSSDFHFDTEILIQLLSRGFRIAEVPIPTYYGDEICRVNGLRYAKDVFRTTIEYRLQRAGVRRVPKYEIEGEEAYPDKLIDPYSSHSKIVRLVPPGSSVLDVGCGTGVLGRMLQRQGCRLTGVDSGDAPDEARYATFSRQDIDFGIELPPGETYDVAIFADVLEHVRAPREILVAAAHRLNRGGRIIASTGNVALWYYRLSLLFGRFNYMPRGILDETHVRLYTLSTFRRLLEESGLRVTRVRVTPIPLPALHPLFARAPWSWIHGAGHVLAKIWKRMFAYQFILEAEPRD